MVVLVTVGPVDVSFLFGEGTCDGSITAVVLAGAGVCFPFFISAGYDCLREVFIPSDGCVVQVALVVKNVCFTLVIVVEVGYLRLALAKAGEVFFKLEAWHGCSKELISLKIAKDVFMVTLVP